MKTLISIFYLTITSFFLSACGTYDWHQKLTIEVETPDGVKSGSAVTAVSWWKNYIFRDGPAVHSSIIGEAVAVNLGNGRYLFALLRNTNGPGDMSDLAMRIVANRNVIWWHVNDVVAATLISSKVAVPLKNFPMLVTFSDINDPKTIEQVDFHNLKSKFGTNYALKSITLEITDDPVTVGDVEKILPWLKAVGRDRAALIPSSGTQITDPIRNVTPGDFSTELYK